MGELLNQYFENVILKKAVAAAVSWFAGYTATHGFHHWGIDMTVKIQNEALADAIQGALTVGLITFHHWLGLKVPAIAKWI